MIIYVLLLLLSCFVAKNEYLSKIALAATLPSVFFAYSDVYLNSSPYFDMAFTKLKDSNSKLQAEIQIALESEKYNKDECESLLKRTNAREVFINKQLNRVKKMYVVGGIVFGIGIFVFLAVITFYNPNLTVFRLLLKNEKSITIFAFAMVVLNYFILDMLFTAKKKVIEKLTPIKTEETYSEESFFSDTI